MTKILSSGYLLAAAKENAKLPEADRIIYGKCKNLRKNAEKVRRGYYPKGGKMIN